MLCHTLAPGSSDPKRQEKDQMVNEWVWWGPVHTAGAGKPPGSRQSEDTWCSGWARVSFFLGLRVHVGPGAWLWGDTEFKRATAHSGPTSCQETPPHRSDHIPPGHGCSTIGGALLSAFIRDNCPAPSAHTGKSNSKVEPEAQGLTEVRWGTWGDRDRAKLERQGQVQGWHLRPGTTASSGEPQRASPAPRGVVGGRSIQAGHTHGGRAGQGGSHFLTQHFLFQARPKGLRQEERSPWGPFKGAGDSEQEGRPGCRPRWAPVSLASGHLTPLTLSGSSLLLSSPDSVSSLLFMDPLLLSLDCADSVSCASSPDPSLQMPPTPEQPSGHMQGPPASESAFWPLLPCGPCIPIMLALAALAAIFLLTTAVLAERLFRRSLRPDPSTYAPTLVWRPGGELWIEPMGTPRERSEDWYGSAVPLLMDRDPDPPTPGGTLEARATAPPALSTPNSPSSSSVPQIPPKVPAHSTFWRPPASGLVSWIEPEQRPEASVHLGSPQAQRQRPGSPDPEWGLQPRLSGGVKAGPAWVSESQGPGGLDSQIDTPSLAKNAPPRPFPSGFELPLDLSLGRLGEAQRCLCLAARGCGVENWSWGTLGKKLPKSHSGLRTQGTRQAGNSINSVAPTLLQSAPKMPTLKCRVLRMLKNRLGMMTRSEKASGQHVLWRPPHLSPLDLIAPRRSEFDPVWKRILSWGRAASKTWPLTIFPPSLLEWFKKADLPQDRLTYNAPPHRSGAPISVSADLPFGSRARGWERCQESVSTTLRPSPRSVGVDESPAQGFIHTLEMLQGRGQHSALPFQEGRGALGPGSLFPSLGCQNIFPEPGPEGGGIRPGPHPQGALSLSSGRVGGGGRCKQSTRGTKLRYDVQSLDACTPRAQQRQDVGGRDTGDNPASYPQTQNRI
ncbi:Transmembrane protein C16orf54 [Camelus dromedarius]|uniref:Transmembrane protein C16orf54 n=1 Tax=Camelus dromedarius TaxID=9838 RepID=A0A5N4CVY4_CAMDR|nr:Transmembrane protein C16orf54 [Camelus dromedarius]